MRWTPGKERVSTSLEGEDTSTRVSSPASGCTVSQERLLLRLDPRARHGCCPYEWRTANSRDTCRRQSLAARSRQNKPARGERLAAGSGRGVRGERRSRSGGGVGSSVQELGRRPRLLPRRRPWGLCSCLSWRAAVLGFAVPGEAAVAAVGAQEKSRERWCWEAWPAGQQASATRPVSSALRTCQAAGSGGSASDVRVPGAPQAGGAEGGGGCCTSRSPAPLRLRRDPR